MTGGTTSLLAALSHQWQPHILAVTLVSGAGAVYLGRRLAGNPRKTWVKPAYRAVFGIFIVSLPMLAAALSHVGCAAVKSQQTACISNLKQLGTAIMIYSQDYNDRLPPSASWAEALRRPLRTADPFHCPAANSPASYGMNAAMDGFSLSDLADPAATVLIFDADAPRRSFAGGRERVAYGRHGGVTNFAFADGHAKSMTPALREKVTWTPAHASGER